MLGSMLWPAAALISCIPCALAEDNIDPDKAYQMLFQVELDPETGHAQVTLDLEQPRAWCAGMGHRNTLWQGWRGLDRRRNG